MFGVYWGGLTVQLSDGDRDENVLVDEERYDADDMLKKMRLEFYLVCTAAYICVFGVIVRYCVCQCCRR